MTKVITTFDRKRDVSARYSASQGRHWRQKQVAPRDAPSSCKWTGGVFYSARRCTMLDLNLIREKPDLVRTALRNRQMDVSPVDDILRLDEKRRSLLTQVEALKAERNTVSKEIGKLKDAAEREKKIAAMREVGDRIAALDKEVAAAEAELTAIASA